jgi:class 3 adenylate cyclase
VHRAILVVDVEEFGRASRTNADQLAVRDAMYKALTQSFGRAGITWPTCTCEDRGDGALVLIPPKVPKILLVTKWPARLVTALNRHNAASPPEAEIRLRAALHAGEIHYDAHGVAGTAINQTFRLAQEPTLKSALAAASGPCVLLVSEWFYDEVVRQDPAAQAAQYRQIPVAVKETRTRAWMCVPGCPRGVNTSIRSLGSPPNDQGTPGDERITGVHSAGPDRPRTGRGPEDAVVSGMRSRSG